MALKALSAQFTKLSTSTRLDAGATLRQYASDGASRPGDIRLDQGCPECIITAIAVPQNNLYAVVALKNCCCSLRCLWGSGSCRW